MQILPRLSLVLGSKFVTDPISDIVGSGLGPCFRTLTFLLLSLQLSSKKYLRTYLDLFALNVSDSGHGSFMGRTLLPGLVNLCRRSDSVRCFHPWCCVI